MTDYTDDFDDDYDNDFCDDGDYADDDSEDLLGIDEDNEYCDEDGVVSDDDNGGDDFDLSLEDATPVGGITLKKAVIFGVVMEWEDEGKRERRKRKKDMKREEDRNKKS